MKKEMLTIILERKKQDKIHRTVLRGNVRLHCELAEQLVDRCVRRGVVIDPDEIFGEIVEKR